MNNIFAFFLFSVLKLRERVSCSPGWQPDKVEHSPMHKSRKLINDRTVGKRMWVRDSRERKLAGGCTVFLRISRRAGRVNRSVNFLPVPMALLPLFSLIDAEGFSATSFILICVYASPNRFAPVAERYAGRRNAIKQSFSQDSSSAAIPFRELLSF